MNKIRINLYDLLLCLSRAQDLVSKQLANHQQQVAYLALRLAEQLDLSTTTQKRIFFAALIHDIGATSYNEKLEIIENELPNINDHAFRGAKIFAEFPYLKEEANIIRYHHLAWNHGEGLTFNNAHVPYESHIVHLADRVCAKINIQENILSQAPMIIESIKHDSGTKFDETLVEALIILSKKEYIWLDLISTSPINKVADIGKYDALVLDTEDIIALAKVFSHVIDFRSKFTARHSVGVAVTAERLAQLANFSMIECKMMLIAGYLHDIGKLAIDNDVLEKPTKLNVDEFNQMRSHTYYTYQLLDMIPEFETIKIWASYHHEKLNGTGYPFHIMGDNITLGARIMAVADIFTAISENRPYRQGMENKNIINVLTNMVENRSIDGNIVHLLIDNFDEINNIRNDAQNMASIAYENFLSVNG